MLDELTREARPLLEAHVAGADGWTMFSAECRDRQLDRASEPLNRMTIVTMAPAEFLSLATPIYREGERPSPAHGCLIQPVKIESIEHGLAAEGLNNLPYVTLTPEGRDVRVIRHEGRHRALVALSRGIERFPVQLSLQADHVERADDGIWHLMDDPPRRLLGEEGHRRNALALPPLALSRERLGLSREDADRLGRVSRTIGRVIANYPPDRDEEADVREWCVRQGPDGIRLLDSADLLADTLEHLRSLETPYAGP